MAWREYLNLFVKYEGAIELATDLEIDHADRGMDPALARRIAEADYRRRERRLQNGSTSNNNESQKTTGGDSHFNDRLF